MSKTTYTIRLTAKQHEVLAEMVGERYKELSDAEDPKLAKVIKQLSDILMADPDIY